MDSEDHRASNPFTEMEGYEVLDASGASVGRVEDTVYDAVSNLLKYVVVAGRPIPAEDVSVDAEAERVTVPHGRSTIETAPEMQDLSGAFDDAVREHYGGRPRRFRTDASPPGRIIPEPSGMACTTD